MLKSIYDYVAGKPSAKMLGTYLFEFRYENLPNIRPNLPTSADLIGLAHEFNDILYEENSRSYLGNDERNYETTAIALDKEKKTFLVACNIKERKTTIDEKTLSTKDSYDGFGIKPNHVDLLKKYFDFYGNVRVDVVTTEERPTNEVENALPHAEMQLLSYAKENNLSIDIIGTNKPPCACCAIKLKEMGIECEHERKGNQKPKNWKNPEDIRTKLYAEFDNRTFIWVVKKLLNEFKNDLKRQVAAKHNFNCTISNESINSMINNYKR